MRSIQQSLLSLFGVLILTGLCLVASSYPAQAKAPASITSGDTHSKGSLQKWLAVREGIQNKQNGQFNAAEKRANTVQDRIVRMQKTGQNTDALEAILAKYQANLANAEVFHNHAADLINTRPGFNDLGQVIDITLADQTMIAITDTQVNARSSLYLAKAVFKTALLDYNHNHQK